MKSVFYHLTFGNRKFKLLSSFKIDLGAHSECFLISRLTFVLKRMVTVLIMTKLIAL